MREDRRVKRSRQMLRDALQRLILAKGYGEITVQDILDQADVGRSTFYAHFRDKDDLFLSGLDQFRDTFEANRLLSLAHDAGEDAADLTDFSLAVFRHVEEYRSYAKALLRTEGNALIMGHLRHLIMAYARHWIQKREAGSGLGMPAELLAHHMANTLIGLVTWWVNRDFPYTAEQMDGIYNKLVFQGVDSLVHERSGKPAG